MMPGKALATVDPNATKEATQLVRAHIGDIGSILPRTMRPEAFARVALLCVSRDPKIAEAVGTAPDMFIVALLNAARLGLDAGTEEFYLVPFRNRIPGTRGNDRNNFRPEIQGIPGYRGLVQLMHRGGSVVAVHADIVYPNDIFEFERGVDLVPRHRADWFATAAERGVTPGRAPNPDVEGDRGEPAAPPRGAYAWAEMISVGGIRYYSDTISLNHDQIQRRRALNRSSYITNDQGDKVPNPSSPWTKHPEPMWKKCPLRDLAKVVPTSAEYADALRERLVRASQVAEDAGINPALLGTPENPAAVGGEDDDPTPHRMVDPNETGVCTECGGFEDDTWHI